MASSAAQYPQIGVIRVGEIEVRLRRSNKRRTLALQVRNGEATAFAPEGLPLSVIQEFAEKKADWLRKQVTQSALPPAPLHSLPLHSGKVLLYLGHPLTLVLTDRPQAEWTGATLHLPLHQPAVHLRAWTRQQVWPTYAALVGEWAARLGVAGKVSRVLVTDTRSRWGSCNGAGEIRLHWLLAFAPPEVLSYVALHEVAHLHEMNHSPRFWAWVAREMPDYRVHQRWLREHGPRLYQLSL